MHTISVIAAIFVGMFFVLWYGWQTTYTYNAVSTHYGAYDGDPIKSDGKIVVKDSSALVNGRIYPIVRINRGSNGIVESIVVDKHTAEFTYWIK